MKDETDSCNEKLIAGAAELSRQDDGPKPWL